MFRGEQLVVPLSLRKDMLNQLHSSHIGIGGCIRRAHEILYWPRMSAEIRDFVSRCTICQTYRPEQAREELQPHELPSRPYQKIAADLFHVGQQTFLIMVITGPISLKSLRSTRRQHKLLLLNLRCSLLTMVFRRY